MQGGRSGNRFLEEGPAIHPPDKDEFSFFRQLPWAKMVTWGLFLGLVYTLRSLFAVFFITFVISYICRNVVKAAYSPFGDRWYIRKVIVVVTFVLLLLGFYFVGRFLVPNIVEQGRQVVTIVRDLRLHEGQEGALPKLYATIRFWFYKSTDAYEKDLAAYREENDPVQLDFEKFKESALKMRSDYRESMILDYGEKAYEADKESESFKKEFNLRLEEEIDKEYTQNKADLEAAKELALRKEMSQSTFQRYKSNYGATPEKWSAYLKSQILFDLYKEIDSDQERKQEYEERFREEYIHRMGVKAVQDLEGKPSWEEGFKRWYEGHRSLDKPYEEFVELEKAKTQEEYIQILGGAKEAESNLARYFRKEKEKEFAKTFREYGIVEELNTKATQDFLPGVAKWVANTIEYTVTLAFHLILSVFLSFFIVWDIPKLKRLIRRLENSRINEFYREVLPGLLSFGWLMGRAFQAQAIIAAVNTGLTFTALYILEMPHRAFLCSIVFICSFIPVVGVVISSIPMVVVGLQLPGGIILSLELVACVLVIHFIETTLLNPKIMGDMLKLHPLLVLVILLVGEHFFGVWGLLLGVPISVYIFRFVILRDTGSFPIPSLDGFLSSDESTGPNG